MKKLVAIMLTVFIMLLMSGIMLVSAAEYTVFTPSEAPGKTTEETTIETGISGMTLTIGADNWTYVASSFSSSSGNKYTGYIQGITYPSPEQKIGTYYTFTFDNTIYKGKLEIAYRHGTNELYITDNGIPMEGYNGLTREADANVTSEIIVEGGHTYTLYIKNSRARLYGCSYKTFDPAAEFAEEISNFSFDKIKGLNSDIDNVDSDLELDEANQSYESQLGLCDIKWESSNPAVISNSGTVHCQKTETKVAIVGTFSVKNDSSLIAQKIFEITVLADFDDASAVDAAFEALTLGDTSALVNNIELPSTGKKGTTIKWESSNEDVISSEGTIYASSFEDKNAILTATISRGAESRTKSFDVIVKKFVPLTINSYSYADASGNPCFTPVDGGVLKGINVTRKNPSPDENDKIIAAVYEKDGLLKNCKMFAMQDVEFDVSMPLEVNLSMDSNDTFKILAMNIEKIIPYIVPFEPDENLKDGAKIYVVGDSTAQAYNAKNYPRAGWAQVLQNYFDGVNVVDYALAAKGSVDFKELDNYTSLKNEIRDGDYLIVQFGHYDSNRSDIAYFTDPFTDRFTDGSFKKSMREYVELAWERGAHPIIATSISRRSLTDNNTDPGKDPGLECYVNAAKELAAECNIPCIDLYAKTNGWINKVGEEQAKDMFVYVKPYDSRFIGDSGYDINSNYYENGSITYGDNKNIIGYGDDMHTNINGANLISQWAVDEMIKMGIPIAQKAKDFEINENLPSYAEATSITP